MKFAKELEQELVPEWRVKYLNYKAGKKYVKAVARAVNRANGTPRVPGLARRGSIRDIFSRPYNNTPLSQGIGTNDEAEPAEPLRESPAAFGADSSPNSEDSNEDQKVTTPMLIPGRRGNKKDPSGSIQYGSFVPTPPESRPAQLELPSPALDSHTRTQDSRIVAPSGPSSRLNTDPLHAIQRRSSHRIPSKAYEAGTTTLPAPNYTFPSFPRRTTQPTPRPRPTPDGVTRPSPRPFINRLLSNSGVSRSNTQVNDVNLTAFDQVKARQRDFFNWMDNELEKIESFYKSKEDEAGERLKTIREQLHEMRNRRVEEIAEAKRAKVIRKDDEHAALDPLNGKDHSSLSNGYSQLGARDQLTAWIQPIGKAIENAKTRTTAPRAGPNSRALQKMHSLPEIPPTQSGQQIQQREDGRDYVRRPTHDHGVPYRSAKRKLKLAMKEYYRGLELLKSYALLNRTAFRKINKKYDKAVNARPPLRYMSEKVNKAWFVQSDVLEGHLHAVEDLYSRYFERGNHKVAVGKLRTPSYKPGQYTGNTFRSGLMFGTGAVFAIQSLIYAYTIIFNHPDPVLQIQTSYLLQIYAGYFLALYLFVWFCLDCSIWARNKINYVFIFEFDPRNHLDWRELVEFPAFCLLVLGLCMWLNFSRFVSSQVYIYFPILLIFLTAAVIFLPAPALYHRSRRWFVYSHWRLLLAGLYPVEFRDFFLGDMYCSLTYLMSNIELFFCLYATYWTDPPQCNSTHSRLLGFFSTLPGIWRALQCIRRYYDTGSIFPHLVNCGKYTMTILYYMSLSLYRIQEHTSFLAIFITFATLNAIYCSIWDLVMDWSLCQPNAKKRFLRDVRGYKVTWPYYTAMIIDPILRFNWVFFILYAHDLQHSSVASFLIAFSEISRRGMWSLFRVENEHCANVTHFKASRDIPLPYPLSQAQSDTFHDRHPEAEDSEPEATTTQSSSILSRRRSRTVAAEEGEGTGDATGTLRRRAPTRTFTSIFAEAHTQDFEKRRKPGGGDSENAKNQTSDRRDDDDDDGKAGSSDEEEDDEMELLDGEHLQDVRRSEEVINKERDRN